MKVALILIGIPVLVLCIFLVPKIASYAVELYPDHGYLNYLVLMDLYATAIPFYFALYQAFKLLGYIDKSKAFRIVCSSSADNQILCNYIQWLVCGWLAAFLSHSGERRCPRHHCYRIGLDYCFLGNCRFAAVLQKLLKEAIDIKSENDLTV